MLTRVFRTCALAAAVVAIGCSTAGTSIPIGEAAAYPRTDPTKVALLLEPPARPHSIIALVEGVAATDDYFTETRTQAAALKAMKKEAARLGAHAIVLTARGRDPYGQIAIGNTTGTGTVRAMGNAASLSTFSTSTSQTIGWQKIRFAGTAIRYTEP